MLNKFIKKRLYRPEAMFLILRDWIDVRGPVMANSLHLQEAAQWLLRAQASCSDAGVSGGYSFEDGWIASYPEATGYIIPTLLGYAEYSKNGTYRQAALKMAEWELTIQHESGAFPGHFTNENNPPTVFNTGQVLFGLLAAYGATKSDLFLVAARSAATWLAKTQSSDGAWHKFDYLNAIHTYNTRTAWALIECALVTDDKYVRDAGIRNLEWALGEQEPTGWFRRAAFSPGTNPFLHNIAYVIQGLLEAGFRLNRSDFIESATRASRAVMSHVQSDGAMPGAFDRNWHPVAAYSCLTGIAQMAVIWLRLFIMTRATEYKEKAMLANHYLKSLQDCETKKPYIRGAVKGSHPISGRYLFGTYPNWAVKFFIDALLLEECLRMDTESWISCW